ncbi:hypothetical protein JW906_10555 [bacterium]|nr:hypothetical protein [bacterium]
MKRLIGLLVILSACAVFAGDQDFILVNETGLTIDQLYCSPTTTKDWEEDVLGVDVLEDGENVVIRFSRDEDACEWDLKIVDEDGDNIIWTDIDLCKAETITLYYEDGEPTALIQNVDEDEEDEEAEEDEEDDGSY